MTIEPQPAGVAKIPTGIAGFDMIANGGLPRGRCTLVSGTAGSAKTVFATHFLVEGIKQSAENGVFVTFEESPEDIRKNMLGFGWDLERWVGEQKLAFVDASPQPQEADTVIAGGYDFGALMARIEAAVRRVGGRRVALDSIAAVFGRFPDATLVRNELFRLAVSLRAMGVTALMTAERTQEYGEIARYGVEEFVADNVVILRNVLDEEKRRRTVEILKFRGTTHQKGEFPFTVMPSEGIVVLPLSAMQLTQHSSNVRIESGNAALDEMCGGGFFRDSVVLVSGATGTGKTLMVTEFMAGGIRQGERCLLLAFEESREQLFRNASGWGVDFAAMERNGSLQVVCQYPEAISLEDTLIRIKQILNAHKPDRVAVDSLSALERVSTPKGFREFVIGLTSFIKHQDIACLLTSTSPTLVGGASVTEAHISTVTDSIILLRYVEINGEMRRGVAVLKMRGSRHDKEIREFAIDGSGMHIGRPFRNVVGILSGNPTQIPLGEIERVGDLFKPETL
ncbi:MAG: circadian clock protein KaiC [bacterium]